MVFDALYTLSLFKTGAITNTLYTNVNITRLVLKKFIITSPLNLIVTMIILLLVVSEHQMATRTQHYIHKQQIQK